MTYSATLPIKWTIITIFCFISCVASIGQDSLASLRFTIFDSLQNLDIGKVTLFFDIDSVLENKLTPNEYPGKMVISREGGTELLHLEVKISARGKFRRKKCDFPPLKLNFDKSQLKEIGLHKTDDYKLVTHCLDGKTGEKLLLKEYMVYELYQILTSKSFQVRLFPIVYKDVNSDLEIETIAFLIENDKELADRLRGELCDCLGTDNKEIDPVLYEQLALLQYMIGNRDMNLPTLHNIKLIKKENGQKMIPVGYDFDFSLLVKAPYAFPGVTDNRKVKRLYLGAPRNAHIMEKVFTNFLSNKEQILDHVNDFKLLPALARKECLYYLKEFYRDINRKEYKMEYLTDD